MANYIRRLFQLIIYIEGTDTCFSIQNHKVPQDINFTYRNIVCNIRPQNIETHRVRLAVGGDKLSYGDQLSTPIADLTMTKLHWYRVPSTPYEKFLIVDLKNLYLKNPTKKAEYYRIAIKLIPQESIDKYDLNNNQRYGYIYVRVEQGIYGMI